MMDHMPSCAGSCLPVPPDLRWRRGLRRAQVGIDPCADAMVGAMMKGFNITWYDDRRLCHMLGCTELMIAFKWDHAVRDFQDPEKRFPTLCCLPANRSMLDPPVDECTDASRYHEVGLRL